MQRCASWCGETHLTRFSWASRKPGLVPGNTTEQMWQGDIHWIPRILAGERVQGCFTFGEDNETVTAWKVEVWEDRML